MALNSHISRLIRRMSLVFSVLLMSMVHTYAQCAQCKAAAATTDESGSLIVGGGINFGVLYLLALPFLLVGVLGGYWWYRRLHHTTK